MTVLVVQRWRDNGELIATAFDMHVWLKPWAQGKPRVCDLTYGTGVWWKDLPLDEMEFTAHDLDPAKGDGVDFRALPEADGSYDVVTFDPDYVAPGGRETTTVPEFYARYGLKAAYETPAQLQAYMNAGLSEAARVVDAQGIVFVKCTNYVSSGRLWLGEHRTVAHGERCGLIVEDIWVHLSDPRMQPKDRRCGTCKGDGCPSCDGTGRLVPIQQHARSNSSSLIIFRKPGRRTRSTT